MWCIVAGSFHCAALYQRPPLQVVPHDLMDLARNARRSGGNSRYGKGKVGGRGYGGGGYGGGGGNGAGPERPAGAVGEAEPL